MLTRPRRADSPGAFLFFGIGRQASTIRRLRGSISPSAVSAIAAAIQTQEGYYPGSLAYQNNNPGNLVYAGQPGASPGAWGFAKFSSYAAGEAALENQITLDATRGTDVNGNPVTNLDQLLTSWAPPSENDTATYIQNVSAATGFDPSAPLSSLGSDFSLASLTDGSVDLSNLPTVDLSSVGFSSSTPLPLVVGAGLVGALLLSKLF